MLYETIGFESSVNSYGRKTFNPQPVLTETFESSVNSYGRKTGERKEK